MELQTAIQNLGFTDKEAAIYLSLLQSGQSSAYQVSKRTGLKRPTTYVILDLLVEKSAVKKILEAKATQYAATDPVELFVAARSKIEQVHAVLPQLQALASNDSKTVEVSYYEGLHGIKEVYKKLLDETKSKSYVGFFAHGKDTPKELWNYWSELNEDMIKNKVKVRGITTEHETTKGYLDYTKVPREVLHLKGLPQDEYSSNISIEMYGDHTQIISHRYEQVILIKNPDIANVLKQIFEIVWKSTR